MAPADSPWLRSAASALDGAPLETLRAYELAAVAVGRLDATVGTAPPALSRLLLLRHAAHAGHRPKDFRELLTSEGSGGENGGASRGYASALEAGVGLLGGGRALTSHSVAELAEQLGVGEERRLQLEPMDALLRVPNAKSPTLLKAALVAGAVAALGAADASIVRLSALTSALVLASGNALAAPWIAAWRLDSAARSAAVQVERYGQWSEWIRAWCGALEREARAAETLVRDAMARNASDVARVREVRRVGDTLAAVMEHLQVNGTVSIPAASNSLGLTFPTISASLERLERLRLVEELTGRGRDRVWCATVYLEAFGGG